MIMLFLIGGLLFLGLSLMVLDAAVRRADDGREDGQGFHQESHHWTPHETSSTPEIDLWERAEGGNHSAG
ncbi:MAG: hypothetical protein ABI273_14875 [Lacunisphaera sp.]